MAAPPQYLFDDLNLTVEARGATLDQRYICRQAHLIHMSPRIQVIQRVENENETFEPFHVELRIFDVRMMRFDLDVWVELAGRLLRDLLRASRQRCPSMQPIMPRPSTYKRLRLLNVFVPEEELAVEVAQVDRVQVDDVDLPEAGEDEVLQKFAAYTAGAYHQNAPLFAVSYSCHSRRSRNVRLTCLMRL